MHGPALKLCFFILKMSQLGLINKKQNSTIFYDKRKKILGNFKHILPFTNIFIQDNYLQMIFRI